MASIFLSHSSKDKDFVRRLAEDLTEMGHRPWLDEQQIKAGDSIITKVSEAVALSDYVVIVLSSGSVQSGWFAREWEAKLWQEINQGKTMVIPILLDDCDIPVILQPKKYADFRRKYTRGFVELMGAISPLLPNETSDITGIVTATPVREIGQLLAKLQSRSTSLAQCLTDGLQLALSMNDPELETFCRQELTGWTKHDGLPKTQAPTYRVVEMYLSAMEINMQSWSWKTSHDIFSFMRQHPDKFFPFTSFIPLSVPQLESQELPDSKTAIINYRSTLGKTIGGDKPELENVPVCVYGRLDAYQGVLEAIRQRFSELLLDRLPRISPPEQQT